MDATRRVDAVIPTYNAPAARLAGAVRSCLASAMVGRVIVVDDGSEPAAAVGLAAETGRVEVVRQANAGPSAARNRGLERTEAEFVLLLDDDDELEAGGGLGAVIALMERLGAGAAVSARREVDAQGRARLKEAPKDLADRVLPRRGEVFRPISLFGASGVVVRRGLIDRGLRFDEKLWIGEDRDFLRRAAELAPVAVCSTPLMRVRVHREGGLSSAAHLARRVRDHLVLLERHCDAESEGHFRESTLWLLGVVAKNADPRAAGWETLGAAARARGWRVPLKARVRARVAKTRGGHGGDR
ncbi:MAG: glycosyltransferase [Phycisphaerales bacterium]